MRVIQSLEKRFGLFFREKVQVLKLSFRIKTSFVLFVLRGEEEEGQQAKESTLLFM